MTDTFTPWDKYPDLKPERLAVLASIIRKVRDEVANLYDPRNGDGVWSFGCRAYERTIFALTEASKQYEWLTILPDKEKPLRFTFAIGSTPFRFYRGDPEEPPSRYLLITFEEFRQWNLDLSIPADALLRIAVETDSAGRATTISVVELNEIRVVSGVYAIPAADQAAPVVVPLRQPPIETPPPVVVPLEEEETAREERNASNL